jgi:Rrf2 family protein
MLSFSRTTGYAVLALGHLHVRNELVKAADIARSAKIPKPYLYTILKSLSKAGLVHAKRGPHGGLLLAKPPQRIRLLDVVEAIEGRTWMCGCFLGLDDCSQIVHCPTQDFWEDLRRQIVVELRKTTLADVIRAPQEAPSKCASKSKTLSIGRSSVHKQNSLSRASDCLYGGGI